MIRIFIYSFMVIVEANVRIYYFSLEKLIARSSKTVALTVSAKE